MSKTRAEERTQREPVPRGNPYPAPQATAYLISAASLSTIMRPMLRAEVAAGEGVFATLINGPFS